VTSSFDAKSFLKRVSTKPGVYRMYDSTGLLLYVGKAKNLKNRLNSYFQKTLSSTKTEALVKLIANIEISITNTEAEALILEHNLIKTHKPRFNVLLRDDKSYPYIVLTKHEYPQLKVYRGSRKFSGEMFGPFPNAYAAKESVNLMYKLFKVRQCDDSYFNNRSRPCLQYQINRCSAPCVKHISVEDYQDSVRRVSLFYQQKNDQVIQELGQTMQAHAEKLEFEAAAQVRDTLRQLQQVNQKQVINAGNTNADVISIVEKQGLVCINRLLVRDGQVIGADNSFPKQSKHASKEEILEGYLSHRYLNNQPPPKELIISVTEYAGEAFIEAIKSLHQVSVVIKTNVIEQRASWLKLSKNNAKIAIETKLNSQQSMLDRYESLKEALMLDELPIRMECFDISHTMGEEAVASCVVFNREGPSKKDYRQFNITGIQEGDDYAAMTQALTRRFKRIKKGESPIPDVLIVDGGKGQLSQALNVMRELDMPEMKVIGISKGPTRKAGWEFIHIPGEDEALELGQDSSALHLIQQIRDEAHRFAILGHRNKRDKKRTTSVLQTIPGVGAKRRKELLLFFGGLQALEQASIEDIARVNGISKGLAEKIHQHLHD
jgi:excinuclease ABC subunit C